jgi:excinuclease ABC subunit C
MLDAVRVLNDLLGLRDCAATMPIVYASQGDLFDAPRHAACMRHQFGTCTGPCAGFVSEADYRSRAEVAAAFLEGRTLTPLDRAVYSMTEAAATNDFERAARWRDKFEQLEWLLAATSRAAPPSTCSPSSIAIPAPTVTIAPMSCVVASCVPPIPGRDPHRDCGVRRCRGA